jgi:hypothetical protein
MLEQGLPPPDVVVQIAEAWVAAVPVDEVEKPTANLRVSSRPDRQEVVLVVLHTEQGSVSGMNRIENKSITFSPLTEQALSGKAIA